MKNRAIINKLFTLAVLLAILLINVGSLRGEDTSNSINARSQAQYAEKRAEEKSHPEWQDGKNDRYQVLEWLIMQDLMKKYQKLDEEPLTDNLD